MGRPVRPVKEVRIIGGSARWLGSGHAGILPPASAWPGDHAEQGQGRPPHAVLARGGAGAGLQCPSGPHLGWGPDRPRPRNFSFVSCSTTYEDRADAREELKGLTAEIRIGGVRVDLLHVTDSPACLGRRCLPKTSGYIDRAESPARLRRAHHGPGAGRASAGSASFSEMPKPFLLRALFSASIE